MIGLYGFEGIAQFWADASGLTLPIVNEELFWGDAGIGMAIMGTTLAVADHRLAEHFCASLAQVEQRRAELQAEAAVRLAPGAAWQCQDAGRWTISASTSTGSGMSIKARATLSGAR